MEREEPTNHPSGEHVTQRDVLEVFPARNALRVVADGETSTTQDRRGDVLPDLSVPVEMTRPLARSYWAAVVEVHFDRDDPDRHPALYSSVGTYLKNRTAVIGVSSDELRIDFQVENGEAETHAMVRQFARQLRRYIGAEATRVAYRINDLDPAQIDAILGQDRPGLRVL
jgi:hypothetical protein